MSTARELTIISFLTLIVRLPWLSMIPMVEAPDENTHIWVIRFCAEKMQLPTLADIQTAGSAAVYGSIPQFGYLPHIAFLKLLPAFPQLIDMRLGSLFMSWLLIVMAFFIGRELFAPKRLLALSLPLMLVFHPQLVFVSSYANNDITTAALAAAVLLLMIKILKKGPDWRTSLIVGFLLAWIALSKYSGYAVIITGFLFLGVAAWLHRANWKKWLLNLACLAVPYLSIVGLWFGRNYREFAGDFTGARTMHYIWTSTYQKNFNSYHSPLEIVMQTRWWRMNFFSFWGWFGYMTRSLPRPFYYGYLVFLLLAVWGGLKKWVWLKKDQLTERANLIEPAIWGMLIFLSLTNLLASLVASSSGISGPQGRYLFPAEIPLMALMLAGLAKFEGKTGKRLVLAILGFNVITYLYSFVYLYSLYGFCVE